MTFGMQQNQNPENHSQVPSPPSDSVSSLCWFSSSNLEFLACGSWSNEVKIWEVKKTQYYANPKVDFAPVYAHSEHKAPVLCVASTRDCKILSGSCDTTVKAVQLSNNMAGPSTAIQIGKHDAPVKTVDFIESFNLVVTGSWDKTVRYWDLRQQKEVLRVDLPERIYCSSVSKNFAIFGTADRKIHAYQLQRPQVSFRTSESPLRYQTRCISLFYDQEGYAVGSIEGRVGIQYFNEDPGRGKKNFAFKCHREQNNVYAVNSISFNPQNTFSTAGSDGTFHFWDKDAKQRLQQFKKCSLPITSTCFNHDGSLFAYAVSYDWSKGPDHYNKAQGSHIMVFHSAGLIMKQKK